MTNIEHLVADCENEEPIKIKVGNKTILATPPKVSTLMEVSKYIGKLPTLPVPKTQSEEIEVALAYAGDCGLMGHIIAILILGKKGMFSEVENEEVTIIPAKKFLGITYKGEIVEKTIIKTKVDNVKPLAEQLLDECSNKELYDITDKLVGAQDLAFFLRIIISLNKASLLKQTKKETTASGL